MAHKNTSNQSPYKKKPRSFRGKHQAPETIYELEDANNRLQDIFRNHKFDLVSHAERKQLAQFYRLLMQQQKKLNLTRLLKFHEIAIKHFIDSICITQLTKLTFPLLDVGTGPGFPGIPLKIKYPDQKILLAEGVQKRVEFLKKVREELQLPKLDIIGRNINSEFLYPVQGVITRAVEDISNTLRNVSQCLEVSGKVFFMKGPNVDPEIKAAATEWGPYYDLVEDHHYFLPETQHERRLLVYMKIKQVPSQEDSE